MAGAIARRSSIASAEVTENTSSKPLAVFLQPFHTPCILALSASFSHLRTAVRRGKSTRRFAAASQSSSADAARSANCSATLRKSGAYLSASAASDVISSAAPRSSAAQWSALRRTIESSSVP